jgi:transposase-like protein
MDDFYFYKIGIMKHKSEDLKLISVRHYLEKSHNYDETSRIFECPKTSLKRWVARFQSSGSVSRKKRTYVSYKITHHQV